MSTVARDRQPGPVALPAGPQRGSRRRPFARLFTSALATAALLPSVVAVQAVAPAAQAGEVNATARIQALLDNPVNGVVNLPAGTFAVRPVLRLSHGETIIGHHTTLRVAPGSGDYAALLSGASPATDLSGLTVTGVTFDQDNAGDPIRKVAALYTGSPRFVILVMRGAGVRIIGDRFLGTDNVNTVVAGSATRHVTISGNRFQAINTPRHDHSSVYTSGIDTTISNNTFVGSTIYSAAIEVHGDQVAVTRNQVRGYYRGANIVSSDTTFTGNNVTGAGCPVDLWSTVAPGLRNVVVSNNVLNRNLPGWARVLGRLRLPMPSAQYAQQVSRDAASAFSFGAITVRGNRS